MRFNWPSSSATHATKPFFAIAALLLPAVVAGQTLPSVDVFLDRLDAYAKQYQSTLPSLSCDEQITSQTLNRKGKVTWEMKVQSTLREVRTGDPYAPFTETREFKSVNGHRPPKAFHTSQMPYFAEGGFAGLVGFRRWEARECFDYALTSQDSQTARLEMTLKTAQSNPSCARLPDGFHRIVIADLQTGRVLHTERTISPDTVPRDTQVFYGGIDYAPQAFGGQTFWLPSRFISHDAENTGRMSATYSNCHRYIGEIKILPGMSVPADGQKP
jgi:hypothetical protein